MNNFDIIKQIAIANGGIIRTKEVVEAGIRKEYLKELILYGELKRIKRGYYKVSGTEASLLFEVQRECPKGIYSYETAAYLWGLLKECPRELNYTVVRGYNTSKLNLGAKMNYHYVIPKLYDIGLTAITTEDNEILHVYDKERTVCDFIRHRRRINRRVYAEVINNYYKQGNIDVMKLVKYGKAFKVTEELEMYMDVL